MLDTYSANTDVVCSAESTASGVRPLHSGSISISPFTPDDSLALSNVISDIKRLNEEIREIVLLKSELRAFQDGSYKNTSLPKKTAKETEIRGNNSIIAIVRSDIEKLKDEANEISILKSELQLYQSMISKNVSLLQECMKISDQ